MTLPWPVDGHVERSQGSAAHTVVHRELERNKAALAGLAPGSRRTMRGALDLIAAWLLSGGQADALTLAWGELWPGVHRPGLVRIAEGQTAALTRGHPCRL